MSSILHLETKSNKIRPMEKSYSKTPDYSIDLENPIKVRFLKNTLLNNLKLFISSLTRTPIEKLEVDLFDLTRTFHHRLHDTSLTINCVSKIHHILQLSATQVHTDVLEMPSIKSQIGSILLFDPTITIQYDIFLRLLSVWNGLLVKWKISSLSKYDYRYSGRSLNVKMLDLEAMNRAFFTIEILWVSTKIFTKPLIDISDSSLIELAIILHEQIKNCAAVFLTLNPLVLDPNYDIEKTIAFTSKGYVEYCGEVIPEENLCNFKHAELKLVSGFAKCFRESDPKVEKAYQCLCELELAYRSFEKHLIAAVLKSTGKAEF